MHRPDLDLAPSDDEFHVMLEAIIVKYKGVRTARILGVHDSTMHDWRTSKGATLAARRLVWLIYMIMLRPDVLPTPFDLELWLRHISKGWPTLPGVTGLASNKMLDALDELSDATSADPAVVADPARIREKLVADSMETIARINSALKIAETFLATTRDREQKFKTLGMIAHLAKSLSDVSDTVNEILKAKPQKKDYSDLGEKPPIPQFYLQNGIH